MPPSSLCEATVLEKGLISYDFNQIHSLKDVRERASNSYVFLAGDFQ
jgi:hypothetical protein